MVNHLSIIYDFIEHIQHRSFKATVGVELLLLSLNALLILLLIWFYIPIPKY